MLRVGVIGIGAMGKNHVRVYSEIENVKLVGVADINRESGRAIAKRYGCGYFQDHTELLKQVDAVTIGVPTTKHFDIGKDAVDAGVHILMEKPLAGNVAEAERLVEIVEENGLTLAVGHIERHNPVVEHTKKLLDEGKFGKIITMTSRRVSNYPSRIRDVGVIMDLAVHDIDVSRYLSGSEVEEVFAASGRTGQCSYEDHATIILKFENEILGIVDTNWLTPMRIREITLTCEKSLIRVNYMAQAIDISTSKMGDLDDMNLYHLPIEMENISVGLKKEEPLKRELQDFIMSVKGNAKPLVTGEDGVIAIKLSEAALRSAGENKLIRLT